MHRPTTDESSSDVKPDHKPTDYECWYALTAALELMRVAKPAASSELARRYAVSITEMEKTASYFKVFILDRLPDEAP